VTAPNRLPGDKPHAALVERMIRVDHAGEYGAARIYEGQLAVLGRAPVAPVIRHMAEQEQRHLDAFGRMVVARRVRPTALSPLWHVAGWALGAATALLGEHAAMACTEAVEEVIDAHYRDQIEALGDSEPVLAQSLAEFRANELEHRDIALSHGAADAPAHALLTASIKAGARLAIFLSSRF